MPDVLLIANGVEYAGWTSVRVERGIEQIAGAFELSVTERWQDATARRRIKPGDACALLLDGQTVVTGYVDDMEPEYSAAARSTTVRGRDLTADLVDCSAPTAQSFGQSLGQTFGQTFAAIAKKLCALHGVTVQVSAGIDLSKPFSIEAGEESEAVFERLERLARHRGVLLVSDGLGGLQITRASRERVPTRLVLGENIQRGRAVFSQRDRYHQYVVKAQMQEADFPGGGSPSTKNAITDPTVRKNRTLTILSEQPADIATCAVRARWECNVRAGRAVRVQYTVQGWTHDGANLWPVNRRVHVVDDWFEIDRELLIVGAQYELDNSGSTTQLALCEPAAFDLLAVPEGNLF